MIYHLIVEFEIETDIDDYDDAEVRAMLTDQAKNAADSGAIGTGISNAWKQRVIDVVIA